MEPLILRGEPPTAASSSGYGSGYGDGSGYGSGYGDGDGDGYGSGYGDGYGSGYCDGDGYGSGYGDGDGSGSGYGYGYGSGYGDGDGSGSGYGSGYGDGDGYGSGYGDGDGSGYGDGDGSGYGYGDGDGDGSKEYWLSCATYFAEKWTDAQRARFQELRDAGATIAYWRSDKNGQPANAGGKIEPAAPGVIHTAPGPLQLCQHGTLHATVIPPKWEGERWWIVAMHGEVAWQDDKCGSLKREIIGEAL